MAEADFFRDATKQSIAQCVKRVEQQTSAEIVVTVRRRVGDYRVAAYHFGFVCAGLVVLYLLLAPQLFTLGAIGLDAALGFALGVALALNVSTLLRLLVREAPLQQSVERAARVAFYDLGVSRTSGRTGVLVFVATFERRALVLGDVGVDVAALGAAYAAACATLSAAVKARDVAGFQAALESLGPLLGAQLPRAEDDVNELPDEVR